MHVVIIFIYLCFTGFFDIVFVIQNKGNHHFLSSCDSAVTKPFEVSLCCLTEHQINHELSNAWQNYILLSCGLRLFLTVAIEVVAIKAVRLSSAGVTDAACVINKLVSNGIHLNGNIYQCVNNCLTNKMVMTI